MAGLQQLLEEFADRNGIDAFHPDEEGRFHVVVDDTVRVECFERFEQLHLVSPLGQRPEQRDAARQWSRRVLNHALKLMKNSRSTPALREDGDAILFARIEIRGMSADDFESRIEEHVNTVEKYRRVLDATAPMRPMTGIPRSIVRP